MTEDTKTAALPSFESTFSKDISQPQNDQPDDITTTNNPMGNAGDDATITAEEPEMQTEDVFYFNLRHHYDPWEEEKLKLDDIIEAVHITFPNDRGTVVQPLWNSKKGIYKVVLNEPVPKQDYTITLTCGGVEQQVKLYV